MPINLSSEASPCTTENLKNEQYLFGIYCELLDQLPAAAYILSTTNDYHILYANTAFYRLVGYDRDAFRIHYGNCLGALTPDLPKHLPSDTGESFTIEQRILLKRHSGLWLRTSMRQVTLKEQTVLLCISVDISHEKQAQHSITKTNAVTARVFEWGHVGAFCLDPVTQLAHCYPGNTIFDDITQEIQMQNGGFLQAILTTGMVEHTDEPLLIDVFHAAAQGKSSTCELRLQLPEDQNVWVRLTLETRTVDTGKKCIIGIFCDITEQKIASLRYLQESLFLQASFNSNLAFAQVDVTIDTVLRCGGILSTLSLLKEKESFSSLVQNHIAPAIHPEDRCVYLEFLRCENMISALCNGITTLQNRFRCIIVQNKMEWITLTLHLFRDPTSRHVMALILTDPVTCTNIPAWPAAADKYTSIEPFDMLVSQEGDLAYLVDLNTFELLQGNQAFYNRVGISPEECAGRRCYELLHHRTAPCPFCNPSNWSREKFYLWRNFNQTLEQEFLVKNKIVSWHNRDVMMAIAVDISNNKIANFMDSDTEQTHLILSGVQHLIECSDLQQTLLCAAETIGYFFLAQAVQFWSAQEGGNFFLCSHAWGESAEDYPDPLSPRVSHVVNAWLQGQSWNAPRLLETAETVLQDSVTFYELLKEAQVANCQWYPVHDEDKLLGIFAIFNIHAHLLNQSFLEVYCRFLTNEWKKHHRMEALLYANSHDSLTKLLSRAQYERFASHYDPETVEALGIEVLDINDLKGINTRCGVALGDYFIKELAAMLRQAYPDENIFRLDGDEFLVAFTGSWQTFCEKNQLLDRLLSENEHFTVSRGFAWDNIEKDWHQLLQKATQTMSTDKKRYYDSIAVNTDSGRQEMLHDLIGSIERREFEVYLQPKVDLRTRRLSGAEALIRYNHQEYGVVAPGKFIDRLEKNHFIRYVDLFVFDEVCRILQLWSLQNHPIPVLSLNFSRQTLDEYEIFSSVEKIFSSYSIPKSNVEIEITESILGLGKDNLFTAAEQLFESGFSISLDDFGTKYTNLSILTQLRFHVLKIDRSLVASLTTCRNNQIILKNIIVMCREMGISVIAEGIETEEQARILLDLGCCYGQGYLFGKPMRIPEFESRFITKDMPHLPLDYPKAFTPL